MNIAFNDKGSLIFGLFHLRIVFDILIILAIPIVKLAVNAIKISSIKVGESIGDDFHVPTKRNI